MLITTWHLTTFRLSGIHFLRYCSILLFLLLQCKLLFVISRVQRKAISKPHFFFWTLLSSDPSLLHNLFMDSAICFFCIIICKWKCVTNSIHSSRRYKRYIDHSVTNNNYTVYYCLDHEIQKFIFHSLWKTYVDTFQPSEWSTWEPDQMRSLTYWKGKQNYLKHLFLTSKTP